MIAAIKVVDPKVAETHEKAGTSVEDLKRFIYDFNYEILR